MDIQPNPASVYTVPSDPAAERKYFLKQWRKTVSKCAFLLVALWVTAELFAYGIYFVLQAVAALNGGTLPLSEGMTTFLQSYLPYVLSDLFAVGLGLVLFRVKLRQERFAPPQGNKQFWCTGIWTGMAAGSVGSRLYTALYLLIVFAGLEFNVPDMSDPRDSLVATILCTLYTCLFAPVFEEILMRGIVLKAMQPFGEMTAIIVSSVLFGMMHMNPMQFPGAACIGLLLGYLTVRTKSLIPAILAHIINNTLVTLPTLFVEDTSWIAVGWDYLVLLVSVLLMILFVLRYGRGFTTLLKQENTSLVQVGQKLSHAVISPGGIVYLLCFVYSIVTFLRRFVG